MSAIEIRPVRTRRDRRRFLTFPWRIYRDDPLWVPPLLPQRAATIDPQRGVFFQRGEAEFFIAWRDGEPVGTIATAEDKATNAANDRRDCMIGFFECVDDEQVAQAIFRHAAAWATGRGLDTLYGPFDLDYEDSYGVLIEGRDRPPALLCGHTPPYYQAFFENFGFRPARGDNLAYAFDLDLETRPMKRLFRLAERLRGRSDVTIRGADLDHWSDEIDRIHRLMNIALAHLPDHLGWRRDVLEASLAPFRDIADPELILFAEVDGEAVGWFPGVPNLNEAFIHANGLRRPWDYVRLWWHMRRQTDCLAVKSVLVHPDYWGTSVTVLLFSEMAIRAAERGYKWLDLSLTSADNPNTPVLAERMGARLYKRYRVYRLPI